MDPALVTGMTFNKWIDTFLSEKGVDSEERFEVEGKSGLNSIPVGSIVSLMKQTSKREQHGIKSMLVKIDFVNGDVRDYLKHLAKAVAV